MKYLFVPILMLVLSTSCSSYRISIATLQDEFQLKNNSLKEDRLIDIPAKKLDHNKEVKDVVITVDKTENIKLFLKGSRTRKNISIMGDTIYSNFSTVSFYPLDAWVSDDFLLHYKKYCASADFQTISLDDIEYAEIDFNGVKRKGKSRKGIWIEPSPAQQIDGFVLSVVSMPNLFFNVDTVKINGVNFGIETQWIFGAMMTSSVAVMGVVYLIAAPFHYIGNLFQKKDGIGDYRKHSTNSIDDSTPVDTVKITVCDKENSLLLVSGLNIGLLGSSWQKNRIDGVNICGLGTISEKINGFSLTLGATVLEEQNGVVISGLVNTTQKGNGIQIGLVNYAKDFKGIQIGLWNQIGKIGIPFLNIKIRKK